MSGGLKFTHISNSQCSSLIFVSSSKAAPPVAPLQPWGMDLTTLGEAPYGLHRPIPRQDDPSHHRFLLQVDRSVPHQFFDINQSDLIVSYVLSVWDTRGPCNRQQPVFCEELKTFLSKNDVKHVTSAPFHPATNGLAKCVMQIVRKDLKKEEPWQVEVLMAYRTTGVSPSELLQGRRICTFGSAQAKCD